MKIEPSGLFYASPNVDRMAVRRKDEDWVKARLTHQKTRFVALSQTQNLFMQQDDVLVPSFLSYEAVEDFLIHCPWAYLGCDDEGDVFVIDFQGVEISDVLSAVGSGLLFEDLRKAGPLSDKKYAAQFAYGRGLMFWHSRHQFCGACGSPTKIRESGHVRKCVNSACGLDHFPRTDPAVIMLVHDGERCLLSNHARMREGMYSTLAGFVEPGETLEGAVRREVMEETGIRVGNVIYAGSQPWPFPTALMLGYYAEALSYDISLDDDELDDAQWFSRDDLKNFSDVGKHLPSHDSIARSLIENWLKAGS